MPFSRFLAPFLVMLLATPALAAPTPAPHASAVPSLSYSAQWLGMTNSEKQAYVRGVVDGVMADRGFRDLLVRDRVADESTMALYNFYNTHQAAFIAFVDGIYAKYPKVQVGLRGYVVSYFIQNNPDYEKRVVAESHKRLAQFEQAHPSKK